MFNERFLQPNIPIEDRVKHLEDQLPILGRLEEQNTLFKQTQTLNQNFIDCKAHISATVDSFINQERRIAEINKKITENYNNQSDSIGKNNNEINDLVSRINKISVFNVNTNNRIKQCESDKDVINENVKSAHEKITQLNDLLEVNKIIIDDLKNKLCRMELDHSSLMGMYNDNQMYISKLITHSSDLAAEFEHHKSSVKSDIREHISVAMFAENENTIQHVQRLRAEITDQIAALPKPTPPNYEAVKADIAKQFEPSTYDAKNANLRAQNNETRIMLMEKKIEQIFLLLKQHELNK